MTQKFQGSYQNYTLVMSNNTPTEERASSPGQLLSSTKDRICAASIPIRIASFFCLGTCAWALVNAIFAQLPIILGWNGDWSLASSIALCVALSNVFPFFWSIAADARGGKPILPTTVAIGILLLFGLVVALVFCFADIATITQDSPVLLLVLSTCSGVVGVMSLVLFFPHAYKSARLDNGRSICSLNTGTAIANLFLAIMAMVQGPGLDVPNFSMGAYFGICVVIFVMALMGWVGTIAFEPKLETADDVEEAPEEQRDTMIGGEPEFQFDFWKVLLPIAKDPRFREANKVQLTLNALAFFLPGVVPFSVAHFPNPELALQYLTISQLVAQTIGISITGILSLRTERLTALLIVGILIWIPVVVLSIMNPLDSFSSRQENATLPIVLNALFQFLYGYLSTTCFQVVGSRCKDGENGEHVTRVLGFLNQVGSMAGSIVGYLVVTQGGI